MTTVAAFGCGSGSMGGSGGSGGAATATSTSTSSSGAISSSSSSSGASTSSSGTSSSSSGAGGMGDGRVAVFIAQGDVGRTTISCDDGKTWTGDTSWDQTGDPLVCGQKESVVCFQGMCPYSVNGQCNQMGCCNDTPDIAKGVVFGGGKFVATWGWGQPGAVRTSEDGITWTTTHPNDTFGGLAFGGGTFVAASRSPFVSTDGTTWAAGGAADFRNADGSQMWSVRRFAYADVQGGRFVAVASGDTSRDMLVSSDAGASWWRPTSIPDNCAGNVSTYGGIVSGNGVILIVDQAANACRSTDGGKTWTVAPTGLGQILSHGVWDGKNFLFWGDDAYQVASPDGVTWTKTPMTTPLRLGPVARGESGTFVGINSVWQGYQDQRFYRSTDGLSWEELPAGSFAASHPIFYITSGRAKPSAACPAP